MAGPSDFDKRLSQIETTLEQLRGAMIPGGGFTDPAPDDIYPRWPRWPFPRWPFPFPIPQPYPNPIADPAPMDWFRTAALGQEVLAARRGAVIGPNVDPSPVDLSRFTAIQLEGVRDMITLERKRLDALESLVSDKVKALKG